MTITQIFSHMTVNTSEMYAYAGTYLALGSLFHILEDSICGTVPSMNPKKRIGLKLFYVGSFTEYMVVLGASGILLMKKGIV